MDNVSDVNFSVTGVAWSGSITIGNFNNDAYNDVIIGASSYLSNTGQAIIYYGSTSMDNTADVTMTGESSGEELGKKIIVTDLNNDGFDEAILAGYGNGNQKGIVNIYYGGNSMDNISDLSIAGWLNWHMLGESLSSGNFNNDAYDDLMIYGANKYYLFY